MLRKILVVLFSVVLILLIYYVLRLKIVQLKNSTYPYTLSNYSFFDENFPEWTQMTIQPVVLSFKNIHGNNYALVLLYRNNSWETDLVFLTGEVNKKLINTISLIISDDNILQADINELKKNIKPGSRIKIDFLSDHPESATAAPEEFCQKFFPTCDLIGLDSISRNILDQVKIFKPSHLYKALAIYKNLDR